MSIRRTLILALSLTALAPAPAHAASASQYLASRLTLSGGFAEAGSSTPSVSLTEWAVMGITAAGGHPATMHRAHGRTPLYFLAVRARSWSTAYDLERGILAAAAMGRSPYNFGGRNLVAALRTTVAPNGRIGPAANSTYWGVLALRAAGAMLPNRSLAFIRSAIATSGGYSWAIGAPPDSNDTAAAVMALRAGGIPCTWRAITGAYRFMATLQRPDRGYALTPTAASDSMSTAWVVQARLRCGLANSGALSYLAQRQLPSGAFNYQPGYTLTPAWVTAQVLPARYGRSYPILP
ncbi:MAG: hypothetical protein ACXVYV_04680 [Gaiellales bacterium]